MKYKNMEYKVGQAVKLKQVSSNTKLYFPYSNYREIQKDHINELISQSNFGIIYDIRTTYFGGAFNGICVALFGYRNYITTLLHPEFLDSIIIEPNNELLDVVKAIKNAHRVIINGHEYGNYSF